MRSWFDRPWFYPATIASFALGHALDLLGTYAYQPHFEHESNPLFIALQPYGLRLNWPMVILGKVMVCLICAGGLSLFLRRRRRYFPNKPGPFREMLTHFIYGRPLGWVESCFKLPRSALPPVLVLAAIWSFGGPYYAYLGYGNLASKYGWRQLGGIWVGRYWIDWGLFVWVFLSIALFCRLLWRDYCVVERSDPIPPGGELA